VNNWSPTSILTVFHSVPTSTSPIHVDTDAGQGYLKALGNNEGPHALAREWVGTHPADWFGLRTFDVAILRVTDDDELNLENGKMAESGQAFISRYEIGDSWSGTPLELTQLDNPSDLSRLVVFDTWIRNWDRHSLNQIEGKEYRRRNENNGFLSTEQASKGKFILKAIDHTHCFRCEGDLSARIRNLKYTEDSKVYGLFREFRPYLDRQIVRSAAEKLVSIDRGTLEATFSQIPSQWEVSTSVKSAWMEHICRRASFVADRIEDKLFPQRRLKFREET
jgi:hypothetical protein